MAIREAYDFNDISRIAHLPEAREAIMRYMMLQKLGGGYTLETLDRMEYYDYLLLQACIAAETHKENETLGSKYGGADDITYFTTESDYQRDLEDDTD